MVKRSTLLKTMSIILIILGVFSIIGVIATFAMGEALNQTYTAMGLEAPSMLSKIINIVAALILLFSGIMGVASKSKKTILIIGVILSAYYVINILYATITVGFAPLNFVGLIVPILYMWGWYQSN